jgi:crotonobetainyl-CoA:carnitine CoA-transferase CaiB-like acyl-CoA transferase
MVKDIGFDLGTGMWAVQGILAALHERQRTGKGRLVECSLLETAIGFSSWTSAADAKFARWPS